MTLSSPVSSWGYDKLWLVGNKGHLAWVKNLKNSGLGALVCEQIRRMDEKAVDHRMIKK